MRHGHHRRDLRFPLHACGVLRDLSDRTVVVLALDEVKEVQAVPKYEVAGDAIAFDRLEHLRPNRAVVLLVAFLGAGLQSGVETDLHPVSPVLVSSLAIRPSVPSRAGPSASAPCWRCAS